MSILVLGGVRSGIGLYAELLAKNYKNVTYIAIAIAVAVDEEIGKRIERYKLDRPKN